MNLANNGISDKGGIALTRGLLQNRSLKVIDLRNNKLSQMTGLLMMPLPKLNPRLVKIHLEFNVCTLKVIEELNLMMAKNAEKIE